MPDNVHFIAEHASYSNAEEEAEARKYLESWKKFQIIKLNNECYSIHIIDEQWIIRDPIYIGTLCQTTGIALKLAFKVVFKFERPDYSTYLGCCKEKK